MFYDKEIELYKKGTPTKNNIGQMISGSPVFVANMIVDIQPYSTEEAKKEYGFTIECTKRMFCDIEDININSSLIKYQNKDYEITKVIEWDDDYMEVMLYAK